MRPRRSRRIAWIVLLVLQIPLISSDGSGMSFREGPATSTVSAGTTNDVTSGSSSEGSSIGTATTTTEAFVTTTSTGSTGTTYDVTSGSISEGSSIINTITTTEVFTTSTTTTTSTIPPPPPCCSDFAVTELNTTKQGTNSLDLVWKDPPLCGGWPIVAYEILIQAGCPICPVNDRPLVNLTIPVTCVSESDDLRKLVLNSSTCGDPSLDARLLPCTPYFVSVKVRYDSCQGTAQGIQTFTAPSTDQSHVTNLTVGNITSSSFTLSWEPPSCSYQISRYRVSVNGSGGSHTQDVLVLPGSNSYSVNASYGAVQILPCSEYVAEVVPVFVHGFDGVSKENRTATTRSERISMKDLTSSPTDSAVSLTWKMETPPSCAGKIKKFDVSYNVEDGNTTTVTVDAVCHSSECSYNIKGPLSPCSNYTVSISTVDVPFDTGVPASITGQTVLTQPGKYGALGKLSAAPEDTSIELGWRVGTECLRAFSSALVSLNSVDPGGSSSQFRVPLKCMKNTNNSYTLVIGQNNNCSGVSLPQIDPCTDYDIEVQPLYFETYNSTGSKTKTVTKPGSYGAVDNLTAAAETVTADGFQLKWQLSPRCFPKFTGVWLELQSDDANSSSIFSVPRNCTASNDGTVALDIVSNTAGGSPCTNNVTILPCGNYTVRVLPIFSDKYNGIAGSTVVPTKPGPYGNVTNLSVSSTGPDWLQLQWSLSSRCYSRFSSLKLSITDKDQSSPKKAVSIPDECIIKSETNFILDISSSGGCYDPGLKLEACGFYSVQVLPVFSGAYDGTSGEIDGYTSPGSLGAVLDPEAAEIESTWVRIQWRLASRCFRRFTAVQLSFKEENAENSSSLLLPANCTKKDHGSISVDVGSNSSCPEANQIRIEPCRRYEIKVLPTYADLYQGEANSTRAVTKPGNDGSVLNLTSMDSGVDWVHLQWRVPDQCSAALHAVELNVTSKDGSFSDRTTVGRSQLDLVDNATFSLNTSRADARLNLTACTLFNVQVLPRFFKDMDYAGTDGQTQAVTHPGEGATVKGLQSTNRGESWIQLSWETPECTSTANLRGYTITVQNDVTIQLNTSCVNTSDVVTFNLTQGHCGTSNSSLKLTSCTLYTVAVTPQFDIPHDWEGAAIVSSIETFTSAAANDTWVRLEGQSNSSNGFQLVWQEPRCRIPFQTWDIRIGDPSGTLANFSCPKDLLVSNETGFFRLDVTDPIRCGNYSRELLITPCTNYSTFVKPAISQIHIDDDENQVSVTTQLAYPSEVRNLTAQRQNDSVAFTWDPPEKNPTCVQTYRVHFSGQHDDTVYTNDTKNTRIEYRGLKPCSDYNIRVETDHVTFNTEPFRTEQLPSVTVSTSTLQQAPGPPQNLNASHQDLTMVITWMEPTENPQCLDGFRLSVFRWLNATYTEKMEDTNLNQSTTHWEVFVEADSNYTIALLAYAKGEASDSELTSQTESITYAVPPISPATDVAAIAVSIVVVLLVIFCIVGYLVYKRRIRLDNIRLLARAVNSPRTTFGSSKELTTFSRPLTVSQLATGLRFLFQDSAIELSMEYEDLQQQATSKNYPKTAAENPANKEKNRYINILPFDHSRVPLAAVPGDPTSDYINASFVKDLKGNRRYIAAQGPKAGTVSDFWRMIWEQNVRIVIMLTGLEEQGRPKCAQYWPDTGCAALYNHITVSTTDEEVNESYTSRTLMVTGRRGDARIVHHVHFTQWPDFGCPRDPEHLLSFVETIQSITAALPRNSPVLVHCSAGVGRTGTFIAVDMLTQEVLANRRIDIFNTVLRLRNDRTNMVQTEDQYVFVYQCMVYFAQSRLGFSGSSKG